MRTLPSATIALILLALSGVAFAQELVFGTRVGMTVADVLAAVPGSVRYDQPRRSGNFDANVQFHVASEGTVAGVPVRAGFGFVDGGLQHIEIIGHVEGSHDDQVLAGRRLYQAFVERFGSPLSNSEAVPPPNAPPAFRDMFLLRAEWYTSSVSTRYSFTTSGGSSVITVFISYLPSGL